MSALDETLDQLRESIRQARGALTSVYRARSSAAEPDELMLVARQMLTVIAGLNACMGREIKKRTAPHAFFPGLEGCCATCGGAEDRTDLHPEPRTNHEGAALAAGGG